MVVSAKARLPVGTRSGLAWTQATYPVLVKPSRSASGRSCQSSPCLTEPAAHRGVESWAPRLALGRALGWLGADGSTPVREQRRPEH
jgi:hypothetical protein